MTRPLLLRVNFSRAVDNGKLVSSLKDQYTAYLARSKSVNRFFLLFTINNQNLILTFFMYIQPDIIFFFSVNLMYIL